MSHFSVKTIFRVIDPETEAAQARLEAMRTGKYKKTSPQNKFLSSATGVKAASKSKLAKQLNTFCLQVLALFTSSTCV